MSAEQVARPGGCACGAIRFVATGSAARSGLCHCLTCQKAHAAPFFPFVVFRREQVALTGASVSWETSPGYDRAFCGACGAHAFALSGKEIEVSSSAFDDASAFPPQYESWVIRRVPWLTALHVPQFENNRTA